MNGEMGEPPNFNRIARPYRWMEWFSFGPCLALTRETFLTRTAHARRALVIGDGDGRFTARLLRTNLAVEVDAVDSSSAMLQELRRRAGPHVGRVRVHLADARTWQAPAPILIRSGDQPYDLIATHFFLDCLTEPEIRSLAARISNAAAPSALWLVSEFAIAAGWFGRLIARPLVCLLYLCFGLLTGLAARSLPDYASALRGAGFTQVERKSRLGGLLVGEIWCNRAPSPTLSSVGGAS
jgi:SAM-dependent methyltransferase